MSLPRLKSIFDAEPLRAAFATVVACTGAPPQKRSAEEMTPAAADDGGCEITECSDADFNDWFERQKPNLDAANADFEHRRFSDHMLQAWMTLSTAATKAQVAYTDEMSKYVDFPKRPHANDFSPYAAFHEARERDAHAYPNGIPEEYLKHLQDEWQKGLEKQYALRKKPLTLLARAEQVQLKVSRVV
tara:strand:- start:9928 stop:10491 length:564 start_codon:yes stop_codon:yes gene_type:complete